jgi:ABC-type polysaccharide/polyol phosphate export permease
MQILFFITPVIWTGDRLSGFEALLQFNPLYHLLELVRTPLLGSSPPLVNWLVSIGMAAAGIPIAIALFGRYRARIAYWI